MLAGPASELGLSCSLHVHWVDDVKKLLHHGNLLVHKVNFAIHRLRRNKKREILNAKWFSVFLGKMLKFVIFFLLQNLEALWLYN